MAQRNPDFVQLNVVLTRQQVALIQAIHEARKTPENRISKATVIREALTIGLDAQRQMYNVAFPVEGDPNVL